MKEIISKGFALLFYSALAYLGLAATMNLLSINGRSTASWATSYIQRVGDQEFYTFRDLDTSITKYDYVVLGSSHAMHGYDPRIFRKYGYDLFNFGSSNQHSTVSYILAKYYLDLPEKPIFLIDVYHAVYEGYEMESTFRYMANLPDTKPAWELFKMDPDMRTWNSFVSRLFRDESIPDMDCKRYVENGFCENVDTINKALVPFVDMPRLNEERFQILEKLLDLLESRGCRYVLVAHPMTKPAGFKEVHLSFVNRLMPLVQKHKATFIDHTLEDYVKDNEHFYNQTHLNQAGIEIYNPKLIGDLKESGFTPEQ